MCSDIDGTLLDKDRELSARTISIISALKDSVNVVLASSRMPSAMRHLQQELGISDQPLICYNGAFVIDSTDKVLVSEPMPFEVMNILAEAGIHKKCNVSIYAKDQWYAESEDYWTLREMNNTKVNPILSPLNETLQKLKEQGLSAHKVMCMGEKEVIDIAVEALEGIGSEVNLYRSKDSYLEISSSMMNKATALESLMHSSFTDIEWSKVISFGDNYNDIELLQASGLGVAVGNAKEEVQQIADRLTLTNKEDGVAQILESIFTDI